MLRRLVAVFSGSLVALTALTAVSRAAVAPGAGAIAAAAPSGPVERSELFSRMAAVNRGLRSSKSRIHVDVALHTFPFISPKLDGTAYFKAPDRSAVNFDSVPALAALFKKVYPKIDPPVHWPKLYTMTFGSANAQMTMMRLEPRKRGNIEYIDVAVDNPSAYPVGYTYHYRSGGTVHFDIAVQRRDGFIVVDNVHGKVDLPSTNADAVSTFSDYRLNIPVDDAVFEDHSAQGEHTS